MGNRAVIVNHKQQIVANAPCIYLHWNGGYASVQAFLQAARHLSIKGESQTTFEQLGQMIAKSYFNVKLSSLNVYLQKYRESDRNNGNNGVYLIDENMNIVGRKYLPEWLHGEEFNKVKTQEIFEHITARHPVFND